MAVDVVGYSRLMGRDESGTLQRLREHRRTRFEPALSRHGGRLVKLTGDGALVEFASAVDALGSAIEFQQAMVDANGDQPADAVLVFRIGLHIGDLIVDGDDLYGDGVNIAARLEAVAPPGGIVLSRSIHDAVAGRLRATFDDQGDIELKNIERPVRAYQVKWNPADWKIPAAPAVVRATSVVDAPLALPDKPSIAVLPFLNMSGDPEQEYFTDGITEDIITELSRFHSLFVIARNSSFSYKGKAPDTRQVGRELGVRYVLEGSIRKSSNRIRVTGQLIDTMAGNHIWAERYDRVLEDIFEVQEELTRAIVGAIAPQIDATEQAKATRRHPSNLTAYEIALRSRAHAFEGYDRMDRALIGQSIREAKEALAIDPGCVPALLALARSHGNALVVQLAADRELAIQEATWAVKQAIELDGMDAFGYALRGFIALLGMQWDRYPAALADGRRAHEMNPNDPTVLRFLAAIEASVGEAEQAIEHLHQALRLSPRQSRSHELYQILAYACFIARKYEEGVGWALRALNDEPSFAHTHLNLVECLVGAGELDKAKTALAVCRKVAPELVNSRLEGVAVPSRLDDRRRLTTFVRIAAGLEDPGMVDALR